MADIKIGMTEDNQAVMISLQQVIGAVGQIDKGLNTAGASAGGLFAALSKGFSAISGIVSAVSAMIRAVEPLAAPGYEFVKSMEQSKVSMAGMIQSMTTMNGQAVPFANAMAISSDMMEKLNRDALKTSVTAEELAGVFTSIMKPGMDAGMNVEQIRQVSVAGANAVKALSPNNGQMQQHMESEMSGLVQGDIQPSSSKLAQTLGITNEDIEAAKNSSEGLFQFLMDKFQHMNDVTANLPDTLTDKEEQLKKVWIQASAAFTEEFEQPIKEGLMAITDLIGEVDSETGKLTINPEIIAVIDEINTGLQEMKAFAEDAAPSLDWVQADIVPAFKDLWKALTDIGSALLDSIRLISAATKPMFDFLGQGFKDLCHDIAEVTGVLKELYNWMAKDAGVKKIQPKGMADDSKDSNEVSPVNTAIAAELSPRYSSLVGDARNRETLGMQAESRAKKITEAAMRQIDAAAKTAKKDIKDEIDKLEILHKNGMVNEADYSTQKVSFNYKLLQVDQEAAQRKVEAVNEYDNIGADKKGSLIRQLEEATQTLKSYEVTVAEVNTLCTMGAGEGKTWYRETRNVNIEGLKDNAKSAIDMLGDWFRKETGKQMTVSSGLRNWGGHVSGEKFDVVDDASTDLEENKNGIRDRMIAYAKSIGLKVLDEYDHPSANATAGHLDFSAANFTATFSAQAKARFGTILTKEGAECVKEIVALFEQGDDIAKKLAAVHGDVSSKQKAELGAKYDEIAKKFEMNKLDEFAKMARELKASERLQFDYNQAQKNLEIACGEMIQTQDNLFNDLAKGTKSAAQVTQEYADKYNAQTQNIVADLQRILDEAAKIDNKPLAKEVRDLLRKIAEGVNDFAKDVIQRIDAELQNEIAGINANHSMTRMQKADAIDAKTRKAYGDKADVLEKQVKIDYKKGDIPKAKKEEEAVTYNRELAKIPSLLDKIHEASKQALEDGLFSFLTEGILQCKSLGDAFRNLAISVLQSIQKIYAEAMTKNIMNMLGFGATPPAKLTSVLGTTASNGFYYDPTFGIKFAAGGPIQGPGTATSDSILARLSNGEFVIKAASVQKYGANFLHSLNSGFLPHAKMPRFAAGGLVGASAEGAAGIASRIQGGDVTVPLKVVNVTDPNEVGRYLMTRPGERIMVNFMKNNAGTMRQILNIRG